ncbi:hypothetical protein [Saccharopolyspora dendranthemae]|uniref:hypothetical protein n=1 Tax=Saccharopolyspora dendranthemae TaxID=1181886 RepID=UPI0016474429|nr:hypothetical protein [Saccharopolyspora dendranthemae]
MRRRVRLLTGASGGPGAALARAASTPRDEVVPISRKSREHPVQVRQVVAARARQLADLETRWIV